ncbi:GmrSD restriction endonuclease domain-containing protein [Halocatena pleomorpha]|uniref:DUF262 domain-containing protein n=1 Tax=Halocatena pleomorpha TaxID=1785090 RepID=A0A3P3R832_9EURY|nr:DUF262 domain-containing protein [Halocatena pleomorpha]RRJ28790.1 DUF262 domain-containing protein [Halocatena pleomorpha]
MGSDSLPECAERIFLYPGDPSKTGIIGYELNEYRNAYQNINFVESSQFIRSLDNDITLRDLSLLEVIDGKQFHIPDYQRNYSWGENQHEEMWETLMQALQLKSQANEKPSDAFFGSLYVAKSPRRDRYEIIDGQQRIATIAIILRNLGAKLDYYAESADGEIKNYAKYIKEDCIDEVLYRKQGPSDVPFLSLNNHDNPWFNLLFEDDEEKTKKIKGFEQYDGRKKNAIRLGELYDELGIKSELYEEIINEAELDDFRYYGDAHKKLIYADKFYENKIDQLLSRDQFQSVEVKLRILVNFTQYLLRSLRVSECLFETNDQELRIEVFQSLNDRGIELSMMDKVRARIVGRFQGEQDSDKQIGRWETVMKEFGTDASEVEEFLAHYLAATEREFKTVTDARNNMLEAFRLREIGTSEVKSRLAGKGKARSFLEELEAYAKRYREIVNAELVDHRQNLPDEPRERVEAILRRLNGLGTTIWRPFVMYLYQQVLETPGQGEFFHEILQIVENIMFRFTISPHSATVIESTFPETTQGFIELDTTGHQFDLDKVSNILIENIDDSAREMFGENFAEQLISKKGWHNSKVKQLLMKLVDEDNQQRNKTGITSTSLSQDTGEVHIEHVFPRSFILHTKEDSYAWLNNFFMPDDSPQLEETINLLKKNQVDGSVNDSDSYGDLKPIIKRIEESFVRDIGNMLLLHKSVNSKVKNNPFSSKLKYYHQKHSKDMDNIANQYFTANGAIPNSQFNTLLSTEIPDDETVDGSANVIEFFNEWWTWKRSVERKTELIKSLLDSLRFPTKENEFESVEKNIEEIIEEDYNTRIALVN